MKATVRIVILFFVVNSFALMMPQKATAQVSISFQFFYDNLSPYGNWVSYPNYGYAWVPNVSNQFIPYGTDGYWVYTNFGWTWVSNYSWGWAPFHYGRWLFDRYYGWIWIPGYEWGPGWVIWRGSEGYLGWAPIGPGISIDFAYSVSYRLPYNQWVFVRDRYFGRTNIYNYYVSPSNNTTIINNSKVINNIQRDNVSRIKYNAGPVRSDVQRRTGTMISPIALKGRSVPGQNLNKKELQLYRPSVEKSKTGERKPAPSKVVRLKDVKPAASRMTKEEYQPAKKQQQKQNNQDVGMQQYQRQQNEQYDRQEQMQRYQMEQHRRQQQLEKQQKEQLAREQQMQRQLNEQHARQQQMQKQLNEQHARQEQMQKQQNEQHARQEQMQRNFNQQQAHPQHSKQQQAQKKQ